MLGHAGLDGPIDRVVDLQSGGVRHLHQLDLVGVFDHPAAGADGGAKHDLRLRCRGGDAVAPDELCRFLNADRAGAEAAILEPSGDERVRAFIFVPGANVGVIGPERS